MMVFDEPNNRILNRKTNDWGFFLFAYLAEFFFITHVSELGVMDLWFRRFLT